MGIARVIVAARDVPEEAFWRGRAELADMGYELLPQSPASVWADREIAFVLEGDDRAELTAEALAAARRAYGDGVRPGVATFLSRGTDADVQGVAAAFGVHVDVTRIEEAGAEVVLVEVSAADLQRVPEGKLHTALEAALNAEVRITRRPPGPHE